ncbi:MAG: GIY-YIG nuclease family protein [bacterium]
MRDRQYYLYILTNRHNTVLYTGVTNDLAKRVWQHREGIGGVFTSRYQAHKLVYYEVFEDPERANEREKQIKAGSRRRKLMLIDSANPAWKDLYDEIAGETG